MYHLPLASRIGTRLLVDQTNVRNEISRSAEGNLANGHTDDFLLVAEGPRPNSTNRRFIEDCLQRALDEIKDDDALKMDPCIDRDTVGAPGAPDIAATIFQKITKADVFVADVSFVNEQQSGATDRQFPNPNVLIELGFAASSLGWERIILVFNSVFGKCEDLPFDLRHRRVSLYTLRESEDKKDARKHLVRTLKCAVERILNIRNEAHGHFLSPLLRELIPVLIFADEFKERSFDEHLNELRSTFEGASTSLRHLAIHDVALELGLAREIVEVADALTEAARVPSTSCTVEQMAGPVDRACKIAAKIKAENIDGNALSADSVHEVEGRLRTANRRLSQLAERADQMQWGEWLDELRQTGSSLGYELLLIGHYNIDSIRPGLGNSLRRIGRQLHLVDTVQMYADMDGLQQIVGTVRQSNEQLTSLLAELQRAA